MAPLEGRAVRLIGLPSRLAPNAETAAQAQGGPGPLRDVNGQSGLCLWWDEAERKYAVLTEDGVIVGAPSDCVEELPVLSPEAGGCDGFWTPSAAGPELADVVASCLAERGFCVLQAFASLPLRTAALEEAAAAGSPGFDEARAETEAAYLGDGRATSCTVLEVDDPSRPPQDALAYLDRSLTELASLLAPAVPGVLGFQPAERSVALVRTTRADGSDPPQSRNLQEEDLADMYVESFVSWAFRRKLCLVHIVEAGGGTFELRHKKPGQRDSGGGGSAKPGIIRIPVRRNRIVLFRHDLLTYAYAPEGESLAVQAWLQEEGEAFEFRELDRAPTVSIEDAVHIISVHERFPAQCEGCEMTFRAFLAGTDALTGVPITRFDQEPYLMPGDPTAPSFGKAYTMHGALVDYDRLVGFDNDFFGISDEEARAMAPSQRWVLETGYATLYNGGLTKKDLAGMRAGTFLGDSGSEWNGYAVGMVYGCYQKRDRFQASCNTCYTTVSRLAHCLGLTGPCLSVDTACSASLVAANSAAHFMRRHVLRSDEEKRLQERGRQESLRHALCGGVLVMVHPAGWIGECAGKMLSLRGRCFTWDASADGFIRGEGCCFAYLRSQDAAEVEERSRHLATLMGSAVTANGRGASLTAPSGPAQTQAIYKSLREGGMGPQDVVIGECHGTATALGDPIEVGAVRNVMKGNRELFPLLHATAKAHVGHEEANAGACALIKAVLMANASASTPNPGLIAINPNIDTVGYPVLFTSELTCTSFGDQVVGVNSFGFGGSIAVCHVWGDAEKGAYKDGRRIQLDLDEALQWIGRAIHNAGTERQLDGVYLGHKLGHA